MWLFVMASLGSNPQASSRYASPSGRLEGDPTTPPDPADLQDSGTSLPAADDQEPRGRPGGSSRSGAPST